jgi:hypothetical protein
LQQTLGGAVLVLISLVPWLGTSVLILVAAISASATLLSRLGRRIEVAV